ncbi:MAG: hypothetical protein Q7U91_02295 [Sideroxyarcus sp.]|nr:hypothetical protein [Sideroxyarcus sp.]
MNRVHALLLLGAMMLGCVNALAQPQTSVRVRGAVTGFDGNELQVKTRAGKDVKLHVSDDTKISLLYPVAMSEVKQGTFVGVTAIKEGPGAPWQAREVHVFSEAQRGTGEGHYDWDLEPGSSMTNANVDAIVDTNNGKELSLSYKGGRQKIVVPRDVPIVAFKPGEISLLKPGAQIFCIAQQAADGSLSALRISVGSDGMKPPM